MSLGAIAAWDATLKSEASSQTSEKSFVQDRSPFSSSSFQVHELAGSKRDSRGILSSSAIIDDTTKGDEKFLDWRPAHSRTGVAVQISQHSSLDRSQYLPVFTSSSTQNLQSSLLPEDWGLDESFPHPDSSQYSESADLFVPDSQSLHRSSNQTQIPSRADSCHLQNYKGESLNTVRSFLVLPQGGTRRSVVPDSTESATATAPPASTCSQSQSSSLPSLNGLLSRPKSIGEISEAGSKSQCDSSQSVQLAWTRGRRRKYRRHSHCRFEIAQDLIVDSQLSRASQFGQQVQEQQLSQPCGSCGYSKDSLSPNRAALSEKDPNSQRDGVPNAEVYEMAQLPTQAQGRSPIPRHPLPAPELSRSYKTIDENIAEIRAQSQQNRKSLETISTSFLSGPLARLSPQHTPHSPTVHQTLRDGLTLARGEAASTVEDTRAQAQSHFPEGLSHMPRGPVLQPSQGTQTQDEPKAPALSEEQSRIEVQDINVPVEIPLPVRVPQQNVEPPPQPSQSSANADNETLGVPSLLYPVDMGEMEFVIPLNVIPRTRDQYVYTINYYRKHIQQLMQEASPSVETIASIKEMLRRASNDTTHVDLTYESDDPSQEMVDPAAEAAWAVNNSQKFEFLQDLFHALGHTGQSYRVIVVARPGKLMGILEKFLQGKMISYLRLDTSYRFTSTVGGPLDVSLLASDVVNSCSGGSRADIIIAFDNSFNALNNSIKNIRINHKYPFSMAPVLHLLVHSSAEHVEHCIPPNTDDVRRMRMIVGYILSLKKEVGIPDQSDVPIKLQVEAVAKYISAGNSDREWVLPGIRPIEEIEFVEPHAEALTTAEHRAVQGSGALKRGLVSLSFGIFWLLMTDKLLPGT